MPDHITRRKLLAGTTAISYFLTSPLSLLASPKAIEISWSDLDASSKINDGTPRTPDLQIIQHGQSPIRKSNENKTVPPTAVTKYNGKVVKIAGYVVPLEFQGNNIHEFLLVPYVGACIHVPPPPPNQLIYVTTSKGQTFNGLFDAVWVFGVINTENMENDIAEVGYKISNGILKPYDG